MKTKLKSKIIFLSLSIFAFAFIAYAQIGGGVSNPPIFRKSGNNWITVNSAYELGASANRIEKGWFNNLDVTSATTTNLTAGTFFQVPTGTAMTSLMEGALFHDTTSDNLTMGTTTSPSTTAHVVVASATTTLYAFAVSSTSPDFLSGGVIELPSHFLPQVVTGVICDADAGTSVIINLSDTGTNDTNTVTCTTTETQFAITSNNTFTAYEDIRLEVGTITGTVDRLSMRWIGYRTSN